MKNLFLTLKRNFFLFLPFVFIPALNNSNSLFSILVLSIYILFVYISSKNIHGLQTSISKVFLAFIFYISIHSFLITDYTFINFIGSNTRHYGIFLYFLLFCLFLFFQSFSNKRFSRIISLNLIIANLLSLIGIAQLFIPEIYGFVDKFNFFDGKIFSTFMLPNFFGQYLSISLTLGVYNKLKNSRKYNFILILPLIAIVLTRSKVAILATSLVFLYFLFKRIKVKITKPKIMLLLAPLLSIFVFQEFFHLSRSVQTRFEIMKSSLSLFLDNLFGMNYYGLESYFPKVINSNHYFLEKNLELIYDKSHNFIIDFLLIGGIPSLLFLILIAKLIFDKVQKNSLNFILLIPLLVISSLSIFSVSSLVLITLIFAVIFSQNLKKINSHMHTVFILFISLITLFFSSSFMGHLYFKSYQETQDIKFLEKAVFMNPTNLKANLEVLNFIKEDKLDEFYIKNKNTFSSQNFVIKRAFLKNKALRGDDVELEIKSLINQNPNDFKNHLLLTNYYYFKKDFKQANQAFNDLKKDFDLTKIQDFQNSRKYLKAFEKFE